MWKLLRHIIATNEKCNPDIQWILDVIFPKNTGYDRVNVTEIYEKSLTCSLTGSYPIFIYYTKQIVWQNKNYIIDWQHEKKGTQTFTSFLNNTYSEI